MQSQTKVIVTLSDTYPVVAKAAEWTKLQQPIVVVRSEVNRKIKTKSFRTCTILETSSSSTRNY